MQLGKSTMESTRTNLFYAHGALTDEGVSGAAMCSGGGGTARRGATPVQGGSRKFSMRHSWGDFTIE